MQLTQYTDYSLRTLIYLGLKDETATIGEIADFYKISKNHLVKVVHNLSLKGFIASTRGKGGGLRLAKTPDEINIGEVVRNTEPHFHVVECFNPEAQPCAVAPLCVLKSVLANATRDFLNTLSQYTLADLLGKRQEMLNLLDDLGTPLQRLG